MEAEAGERQIAGLGADSLAIGQADEGVVLAVDARLLAPLPLFPGDADGGAEDDAVVDGPGQVDQHRAGLVGIPPEKAHKGEAQSHQIEDQQQEDELGRLPVEEVFLDDAALVGDVEGALVGRDQRRQRRAHQMRRQDRLVDIGPEAVAVPPLHHRVGHLRLEDVGQGVDGDQHRRGLDDVGLEIEIGQRRGEKDDARQAEEEVQHRVEVGEPLRQRQAAGQQWIVLAEDLQHAARPAPALADVGREPLGGESGGQRGIEVGRVPALLLDQQRGVGVLGDGVGGDAADLLQRVAANDGAGAAEEGGVPGVVAVLDEAVEELALVRHLVENLQVPLHRVGGIEEVGRLQQAEVVVVQEPADRVEQKVARRDVVAVEDGDQITTGLRQRVVDVAGLGALAALALDVFGARFIGEFGERLAAAVVQQIDVELVPRPVEIERRQHGRRHHVQRFVVGGDEDIDGRPLLVVLGQFANVAAQRPDGLEIAEVEHGPGVDLRQQQAGGEEIVKKGEFEIGIEPAQRFGQTPEDVAAGGDAGDEDQDDDPVAGQLVLWPQQQRQAERGEDEQRLLFHRQRDRADQQHDDGADDQRQNQQTPSVAPLPVVRVIGLTARRG